MRGTLIVAAAVAALAGCSTYNSVTQRIAQSITPYRITIVQGNFVSSEMAAKMQVGMSRDQVKALLGTPLLSDMFHADRWDYLFYFKRGSTSIVEQRDFVVNFQNDRVASWSGGDNLPSNLELLADIDGDKLGKKKAAKEKAVEAALEASQAAAASAASAASASASPAPLATVASPTDEAAQAGSLPATAANAQAAQAANRATGQITSTPTNRPSVTVPPSTAGMTPGAAPLQGQPQFQFHRPSPNEPDNSNPVGPTGPQSSDGSSSRSQPVTSSSQGTQGTGG
ncbi:outer membrane protein assembly factor BamE [Trinickia violacea]|uniref:outer membrane protein assembly factor BamE n=1 Tax=Trinickia violacea TaxID=2571746 RepID=UPI001586E3C9|nr:outer membrane protein assembly factor BamE [Trinickia violacea]